MTVHELKSWSSYFRAVVTGIKTFEVRRNDRDFRTGDVLVLREWDPKSGHFTGKQTRRGVTYCVQLDDLGFPGFVGMSITPQVDQ